MDPSAYARRDALNRAVLHPHLVPPLTLRLPLPLAVLASTPRWPEAIAGTDLARIALELDTTLRKHGARTQAHPAGVLLAHGRLGATLACFVLEGERIRRAVVTHVRAAPFFAGLSVLIHPRANLEAPLLVADLTIAPTGRARALVDACGPAIATHGFAERFGAPLAQVVDSAASVRRTTVPAWLAPASGAGGGRLRASRGGAEGLARVVVRYVDRYLSSLDGASHAEGPAAEQANLAAARGVRDLMRVHGPARKHLARTFGEPAAERMMRLLWVDDA